MTCHLKKLDNWSEANPRPLVFYKPTNHPIDLQKMIWLSNASPILRRRCGWNKCNFESPQICNHKKKGFWRIFSINKAGRNCRSCLQVVIERNIRKNIGCRGYTPCIVFQYAEASIDEPHGSATRFPLHAAKNPSIAYGIHASNLRQKPAIPPGWEMETPSLDEGRLGDMPCSSFSGKPVLRFGPHS